MKHKESENKKAKILLDDPGLGIEDHAERMGL
jgi:hypothetical protein